MISLAEISCNFRVHQFRFRNFKFLDNIHKIKLNLFAMYRPYFCVIFLLFTLLFTNCQIDYQQEDNVQVKRTYLVTEESQMYYLINRRYESQAQQEADQINENEEDNSNQHQKSDASQAIHDESEEHEHHHLTPADSEFWQFVLLSIILTMCGAFCSGMTVGLLSISTMELQMMTMKKNPVDNKMAQTILKVVSDHHLFLVTLLIANAIALESLPLVVHNLMPDWAAILFSTFIVLVVAQIVPQAYCTGPKKIILAYYASPIILVMIKIFWVISYPVAKGLDYLLGKHSHERIQHKDFATFLNDDKYLKNTEKMLLTSTLELRTGRVTEIMIQTKQFFMIEEKEVITEAMVKTIRQKDYSYILAYKEKRNKITGVIKVKELALKYLKESKRQMQATQIMNPNSNLLTVYSDTNLLEMLMLFQARSTRIALVCNLKKKIDPNMKSIMYSKSEMVLSGNNAKEVEVIGVVFLYQLFGEMAKFKKIIERESRMHEHNEQSGVVEHEMSNLQRPFLRQ